MYTLGSGYLNWSEEFRLDISFPSLFFTIVSTGLAGAHVQPVLDSFFPINSEVWAPATLGL